MQCASCKQTIDDDSLHCDQCGIELMQCPRCGHLGKGKRCPADGIALVSRKGAGAGAPPPEPIPPAVLRKLRLRSTSLGVDIAPASGAVLGRRFGQHADVLSRFAQISSQHLELRQDLSGQWLAKDLSSYNHSFINGRQIAPGVEHPLAAGDLLSLGDVGLEVVLA